MTIHVFAWIGPSQAFLSKHLHETNLVHRSPESHFNHLAKTLQTLISKNCKPKRTSLLWVRWFPEQAHELKVVQLAHHLPGVLTQQLNEMQPMYLLHVWLLQRIYMAPAPACDLPKQIYKYTACISSSPKTTTLPFNSFSTAAPYICQGGMVG